LWNIKSIFYVLQFREKPVFPGFSHQNPHTKTHTKLPPNNTFIRRPAPPPKTAFLGAVGQDPEIHVFWRIFRKIGPFYAKRVQKPIRISVEKPGFSRILGIPKNPDFPPDFRAEFPGNSRKSGFPEFWDFWKSQFFHFFDKKWKNFRFFDKKSIFPRKIDFLTKNLKIPEKEFFPNSDFPESWEFLDFPENSRIQEMIKMIFCAFPTTFKKKLCIHLPMSRSFFFRIKKRDFINFKKFIKYRFSIFLEK